MSTEDWKLERDLCRCCHSEGTFKSLSSTDSTMGTEEIYSDVLRNCLDIELSPVVGPLFSTAYSICELCIARLQDAHSFKQQVLRCEEHFHNLYSRNCIKVAHLETEIKQELPDSDDADFETIHEGDCMDYKFIDEEQSKNGVKCGKLPKHESSKAKKRGRPRTRSKHPTKAPDDTFYVPDSKVKKNPSYRLLHSDYEQTGEALKCTRCEKIFNSLNGLRFHVKSQHLDIAKYNCSLCSKRFRTLAPFTKHKLDEHSIDDRIKCNACDNTFNTKTQLIKHRNSFHMLGVKHKCQLCEYECFSVEAMYKHKFKHKTVKDYHCKYCRKSFLRKTTLDLHERIHTGDRRKVCAECGQAFVQKASLNYHMAKYHPEVKF